MQRLVSNTGVVFDALTERDGQLRSLIENSNTRLRDHGGARPASCRRPSRSCRPSSARRAQTLAAPREFARNTDPLVNQLRPAARELTPTLLDLSALAPDLKALFRDLDPLIDASQDGLPGGAACSTTRGRCSAQIDPAARQLVPDPGLHRPLQARADRVLRQHRRRHAGQRPPASAAGACTTCARRTRSNPEILAAYPRRIGTNRPNPYALPGAFDKLAERPRGLREPPLRPRGAGDRQRGAADRRRPARRAVGPGAAGARLLDRGARPDPDRGPAGPDRHAAAVTEQLQALVPDELLDRINKFAFAERAGRPVPAPACKKQAPYTYRGETHQYPHVKAGASAAG